MAGAPGVEMAIRAHFHLDGENGVMVVVACGTAHLRHLVDGISNVFNL